MFYLLADFFVGFLESAYLFLVLKLITLVLTDNSDV